LDTIKLYFSKRKYFLFLLGSLGFVAVGVFLLIKGKQDAAVAAWLSIIFFGACSLAFIFPLFDARPRIILDDKGLFDRTLGVGLIPWSEITGAYAKSMRGNDFISLELKDDEKWLNKLSRFKRLLTLGNKSLGFTAINLNLSGVSVDTQQIYELVINQIKLNRN